MSLWRPFLCPIITTALTKWQQALKNFTTALILSPPPPPPLPRKYTGVVFLQDLKITFTYSNNYSYWTSVSQHALYRKPYLIWEGCQTLAPGTLPLSNTHKPRHLLNLYKLLMRKKVFKLNKNLGSISVICCSIVESRILFKSIYLPSELLEAESGKFLEVEYLNFPRWYQCRGFYCCKKQHWNLRVLKYHKNFCLEE